jgi:5-formyltetrahydrofolate cyclo-ligase
VQVRPERKALPADSLPHLLLRFESNGSHRHMRVALLSRQLPRPKSSLTTEPLPASGDHGALRRELRARRLAVPGAERQQAARRISRLIDKARLLRPGRRIGLYLSMPEELDTAPLLQLARRRGCVIALPRVTSKRHARMRFFVFDGSMRRGAYGIREPGGGLGLRALQLDIVFMPLVGFDAAGNRIGMGKGFYDRCLARRMSLRNWRRPLLVGLAYEVQQVSSLPRGRHDVPMDMIVTESALRRIPRRYP